MYLSMLADRLKFLFFFIRSWQEQCTKLTKTYLEFQNIWRFDYRIFWGKRGDFWFCATTLYCGLRLGRWDKRARTTLACIYSNQINLAKSHRIHSNVFVVILKLISMTSLADAVPKILFHCCMFDMIWCIKNSVFDCVFGHSPRSSWLVFLVLFIFQKHHNPFVYGVYQRGVQMLVLGCFAHLRMTCEPPISKPKTAIHHRHSRIAISRFGHKTAFASQMSEHFLRRCDESAGWGAAGHI